MGRIYFYKLRVDNGGAPCVTGGLLSLAICKPSIRTTARPGDLIFGFAANSLDSENRLIYAARVTEVIEHGQYYRHAKFRNREDCVYEWNGTHFAWRSGSRHHCHDDLEHDLGPHPGYPRASVLLSTDFRYLGALGTAEYRRQFPELARAVPALGRGHRVHHEEAVTKQLLALQQLLWRTSQQELPGPPSGRPRRGVTHRSRSCSVLRFDRE